MREGKASSVKLHSSITDDVTPFFGLAVDMRFEKLGCSPERNLPHLREFGFCRKVLS